MPWFGAALATVGALLCLLAAVGLFRLHDALSRLEVVAKASVLGVVFCLAGAAVAAGSWPLTWRAALLSAFFLVATPVSSHLLGRATYRSGAKDHLTVDELRGELDGER